MAERIVVVAPEPPLGLEGVAYRRSPECSMGEVLLLHPRAPEPRGPCRWARVPHRALLPRVVELVKEGLGPEEAVWRALLEAVEPPRGYEALECRGLRVPRSPPPQALWADYYPRRGLEGAYRLVSEGADAIVLGWEPGIDHGEYRRLLRTASRDLGVPVLADPGPVLGPEEAYEAGAAGYLSLTPRGLPGVPEWLRREMAFVVVPERLGGWEARAEELERASRLAGELGYGCVLLDPVAQPLVYPGFLEGLFSAWTLHSRGLGPLLLGLHNVYELLDADTTGSLGVLVPLSLEAGVSVLLLGEESPKSHGAVLEALIAARMAWAANRLQAPPKDLPFRLLAWKWKRWPWSAEW